jgi:3D (Asp-Asp-Asp) domain-containing protein
VPALDQPIPPEGLIRVVRVREERLTEQTPVAYETVYQALPEVAIDTVYTVQTGQNGYQRKVTRVRYEDGVEVGRVVEAETLAQAPVPQVIGYGTHITVQTLETPDGPVEYWRAYTMYATSYAAKFFKVYSNRTASGMLLTKGVVAIDRSMMPFGTRMYVPGYGFAVAGDTGGGVKGRFIDLGFDDWNYESWHKVVMVYFLTPIPPADQIRWIIPATVP